MSGHLLHAVRSDDGHEMLVLGATFAVVGCTSRGEEITWADHVSLDEARSTVALLAADSIAADITVDFDTIDLTAAVDAHIAEWASPLDHLADSGKVNDDPSGWGS